MVSRLIRPIVLFWKKAFNHPERLISLAALLVAIGALCISFWQLDISRQHNILSVRPFLMVTPHYAKEGKRGLYLTNEGVGLGVLTSLSVSVAGKTYGGLGKSQWASIMRDIGLDPFCFSSGWPAQTAALRPGAEIEILGLSNEAKPGCELDLIRFLTRKDISVELIYKSVYEKEYTFSGDAFVNL